MPYVSVSPKLALLALLTGAGLAGCTAKEAVSPNSTECTTLATVRFCPGKTMMCITEHTMLELADGTRLKPSGPLWEAYQTHQADGQPLQVGYTVQSRIQNHYELYNEEVLLTCLTEIDRCGTLGPNGSN